MYQKGNLRRIVIEKLLAGPLYMPSLIEELSLLEKVSIQSIYTALDMLKK